MLMFIYLNAVLHGMSLCVFAKRDEPIKELSVKSEITVLH